MYGKWLRLPLVTLTFFALLPVRTVYARMPPDITVVSEIMFGSQEEYVPEALHEEGDNLYRLKDWELEPVIVKSREKYVEQEVLYAGTENQEMIPKFRHITSEEVFSGLKVSEKYPVIRMKKVREEWREDFSFPVVFHSYGADEYELGNEKVISGEVPLEPDMYEAALLAEIGAVPENYRVTKTVWAGAPYMDENDILCRNAVASGKRKVADYLVTYGGTVTFPEIEGFRCKAVYTLKEFEREPAQEKRITSAAENPVTEAESDSSWIVRREAVVFTVSLILIIVLLVFAAWLLKKIGDKIGRSREGEV